jgi:hypothetical protein
METTSVEPETLAQVSASRPVRQKRSYWLLAAGASAVSTLSFIYFFFTGQILLYGDAVAHITIARRVFDSRTPGPLQLGTVWLPLPHILTMPFLVNMRLWQSGAGGSIVSMVAYVFAGLGIARLFWGGLLISREDGGQPSKRGAAWGGGIAALVLLLNPNLIYMQATAMTESLSLALTIWAIVRFLEFRRAAESAAASTADDERDVHVQRCRRSLELCAVTLAAAMLTRYDSWFLSVLTGIAVLVTFFFLPAPVRTALRATLFKFTVLTASVPVFWFAYNYGVYQNPLEFATGPYSAHGVEQRTAKPGDPHHPGFHSVTTAALYYWKDARLNLGEGKLATGEIILALAGVAFLLNRKYFWLTALLWLPLLFYALSIAYGSVPIFMPVWWPFSYYNVRYGLQLLPAVAVGSGVVAALINRRTGRDHLRRWTNAVLILLVCVCYWQAWRAVPICLREARVNAVTRMALEHELAAELSKLPRESSLLMYTSSHPGALEEAAIPLRRTVNETNYRIWEAALARPHEWVDYLVAMRDDPVWASAQQNSDELMPVARIVTDGQPETIIYQVRAKAGSR